MRAIAPSDVSTLIAGRTSFASSILLYSVPARNRGIGTAILSAIQSLAKTEGLAVRIHVEHNNPALRLYHRLGFQKIGEVGVYFLMEWQPAHQ